MSYCHWFASILRATPGRVSVGEHGTEIPESGLELLSREGSCDVGQWPRGNAPATQCLNTTSHSQLMEQEKLYSTIHKNMSLILRDAISRDNLVK